MSAQLCNASRGSLVLELVSLLLALFTPTDKPFHGNLSIVANRHRPHYALAKHMGTLTPSLGDNGGLPCLLCTHLTLPASFVET